jgi:hypothetical protein
MSSLVGQFFFGPLYFGMKAAAAGPNSACPVSIEPDSTWLVYPSATHITPEPSVDGPAPMNWPPGAGVKKHAFSSNTFHKGKLIALSGHDLGPQIPHLGPTYLTRLLTMPKSARKVLFTASTVKISTLPTGAVCFRRGQPMTVCGDITALGDNFSNPGHSVFVGVTALDRLAGLIELTLTVAYDTVAFIDGMREGFEFDPWSIADVDFKKSIVNAAIGLIKTAIISEESGWSTPINVPFEIGGSYLNAYLQVNLDPTTKEVKLELGVKAKGRAAKVSVGNDGAQAGTDDGFADAANDVREHGVWGDSL